MHGSVRCAWWQRLEPATKPAVKSAANPEPGLTPPPRSGFISVPLDEYSNNLR
jgi:hypothetical protein